MLFELIAFLGAVGIALIIFATIVLLADRPIKALLVSLALLYALFSIYIFILNKLAKSKEEVNRGNQGDE